MEWYSVSQVCLYTVLKLQGNKLLWNWELESDGKSSIIPLWKLDIYSLKIPEKIPRFIYLFITTTALVNNLNFLKETRGLPFLAGKSSGSSFT